MSLKDNKRWWVLASLAFGVLAVGLDMTILNLALPNLAENMQATNAELQWFANAYNLVFAALLLPMGLLGDRVGRKRMLIIGLIIFGIASLACAYSITSWQLITARVFLGLGAAILVPLSMAIIPVMFSEKERPKAIGVWMMANAIGIPFGPILGGWLLNNYWWGSVFIINIPLVIISLVAVAALMPESKSSEHKIVKFSGILLSSIGLISLTYGVIAVGEKGWSDVIALGSVIAGIVLFIWFVVYQIRTAHPLVDPSLFRSRQFTGGTLIGSMISFALFGVLFALPQYFRAVLELDSLSTGVRLLPLVLGLVVGAPISDILQSHFGAKRAIILGLILLGIGLGIGSFTDISTGYEYIAIWISTIGIGIGLALPAAMDAAISTLSPERSGVGSALLMTIRQIGGTLGVAILGTVLSASYRKQLQLEQLPLDTVEVVQGNVSSGIVLANQLQSEELLHAVKASFVNSMGNMFWVCIAAVVAGIAFTLILLGERD